MIPIKGSKCYVRVGERGLLLWFVYTRSQNLDSDYELGLPSKILQSSKTFVFFVHCFSFLKQDFVSPLYEAKHFIGVTDA